MIRLGQDLGAVNGQNADPYIRQAMEHVGTGSQTTIIWDRKLKLTERHDYDFTNNPVFRKGKHLTFLGYGPAESQLLPAMPSQPHGFVIGNLESFSFIDIAIVGDKYVEYDCKNLFWITYTDQVYWRAPFYGVASPSSNTHGIVYTENCQGVELDKILIKGSTSVDAGLFTMKRVGMFKWSGIQAVDHGQLYGGTGDYDLYRSKNSLGFSQSWIRLIGPHATDSFAYISVPRFEDSMFDEGARFGISCEGAPGQVIPGVHLRNVGFNMRAGGLQAHYVDSVVAEDSFFTYRDNLPAISGSNVKRVRLTRCRTDLPNTSINLSGVVSKVTLDECRGFKEQNIHAPGASINILN